jgi:hypothetical protein
MTHLKENAKGFLMVPNFFILSDQKSVKKIVFSVSLSLLMSPLLYINFPYEKKKNNQPITIHTANTKNSKEEALVSQYHVVASISKGKIHKNKNK